MGYYFVVDFSPLRLCGKTDIKSAEIVTLYELNYY
jgi:hypothetical protein